MKYIKICTISFFAFCITASILPIISLAGEFHPSTYVPTLKERFEWKKAYDDPRPFTKTHGPKQILPPELYNSLSFDVDKMKEVWAEVVGFKAPEVVGKIAPEIKPGKYTYKDKEKYPGLKELMIPLQYEKYFNKGEAPHAGNFPEFEIVPTRQYYYALPMAEATKKNKGKSKLDKDGYLIQETWKSGLPFPSPTGKFAAMKLMWNAEKRLTNHGLNMFILGMLHGYDKNLALDNEGLYEVRHILYAGRTMLPPYGWLDNRAQKRQELNGFLVFFHGPRDMVGVVQLGYRYLDINVLPQMYMYIPSFRRVRKLSATDTQDPVGGQDLITDDYEGWNQKLSPTRYPYKAELIAEREFLVCAPTWDGAYYYSSEGLEARNLKFERRPYYVVKLTQLDPNYVYSYRILYIDKETLNWTFVENYDQKGRLYRSTWLTYSFEPDMGAIAWNGSLQVYRDWIDLHSTIDQSLQLPANWDRKDQSLKTLYRKGK